MISTGLSRRDYGSSNSSGDSSFFIPFLLHCFFFYCQEIIYRKVATVFPFLVFKKSCGAFDHSFISIAFELTMSRRFVKEKPRRLFLHQIAKEEPYIFSLQWKNRFTFYLSKITNLTRCKRPQNGLTRWMFETRRDSYHEEVGNARRLRYKSRILVSLRVLMTKSHPF